MPSSELNISVLMGVYNGDRFVKETVESILNQTFEDFEFIIVNDASSDNTPEILRSYANKDSRIIIIKNDCNLGLTKSLNKGLSKCKGIYIARLDADDVAVKNRLQEQYSYMQNYPETAFLCSDVSVIGEQGQKLKEVYLNPRQLPVEQFLLFDGSLIHSAMFFRRDVICKLDGYNENYLTRQDLELWLRALRLGYKIDILHDKLILLRYHQASLSNNSINNLYLSQALRLIHLGYKHGLDLTCEEALESTKCSLLCRHFIQKVRTRKIAKSCLERLHAGSYLIALREFVRVISRLCFWKSLSRKVVLMRLLRKCLKKKEAAGDRTT